MLSRSVSLLGVAALVIHLSAPLSAQGIEELGLRIGGNTSTITADYASFEHRRGFQLAAHAITYQRGILAIQLELEYARRGYAIETEERTENNEFVALVRAQTGLDYLSAPILARLRYPAERSITPYLLLGPSVDYLVHRSPGHLDYSEITVKDELSDNFSRFTVSGRLAAGVAFVTPEGRELRLEMRLTEGLRDLVRGEGTGTVRNRSIEFAVGFAL